MKVVLLLAGKGTRLSPLTDTTPKPLVHVAGAPVLSHILTSLKQVEIDELVVIAGYLSAQIEAYLAAHYKGRYSIVLQEQLDGTGGAVWAARDHIDGPTLIVFGDTLFDADIAGLNTDQSQNIIWTQLVDDPENYGIAQSDPQGNMLEIIEKSDEDVGRNANIGLYFIADHALMLRNLETIMKQPAIKGEYFFTYALNGMVEDGAQIKVEAVDNWYDCGNLAALLATNAVLIARNGAQPDPSEDVTIIPPAHIGENVHLSTSTIGPNVTIEDGSTVAKSTLSNAMIGRDCTITDCHIEATIIGADMTLANQSIESRILAKTNDG
jgi:glucose-1-phosphate thymidylyltransferase